LATIKPLTIPSKGQDNEQTTAQEGGGQPPGGFDYGGGTDEGGAGESQRDAEAGGDGLAESGRAEPRQDAQAECQQQYGQGD